MSTNVHPGAFVAKEAELDDGVTVGPGAFIGPNVKIGKGTVVHPHAHVDGHTEVGEGNQIFPYASVGTMPQDLTYKGEPTRLKVGNRNQIREFTTLNLGTVKGGGLTTIGDENMFMAYTHVAHDCHVGNRVIMTNGSMLAGHVTVEDFVIIGGASAIYQFLRLGMHSFVTAGAMIGRDLPPFCIGSGHGGAMYGLNSIGLRRRGFSKEALTILKRAYRVAFRTGLKPAEAAATLRADFAESKEALQMAEFLEKAGARGVLPDAGRVKGVRGVGATAESSEASED